MVELTERDIRDWVGDQSFERGLAYDEAGRIMDPRRQGNTLKARCQGSEPQPYFVEVELADSQIVTGLCSCPIGGHCKHTAALLLTWLHHPTTFRIVEDLEVALDRRSKPELIALIRQMLDRHPDLETLLELHMMRTGPMTSADPEAIRRQAKRAFFDTRNDWRASYDVAHNLRQVLALGSGYLEHSDWRSAWVVCDTVARVLLDSYFSLHDEEGELIYVLHDCAAGLGECLVSHDAGLREDILRTLFEIYRWDIDQGGLAASEDIPDIVLNHATAEEKRAVAGWVQSVLPSGTDQNRDWHRQAYGAFLLALQEEWLDDETYLGICRETSRWSDLVDRLLTLERLGEAETSARETSDYQLWQLADLFVSHGRGEIAEQLVRERIATSRDFRLLEWLKTRAVARDDLGGALALAERLFWESQRLSYYQEMRALAEPSGRWAYMQPRLLSRLEAQGQFALLTLIQLDEGHVDQALIAFERTKERSHWWVDSSLRRMVAEAAIDGYPREAIRLFAEEVEQRIGGHNRGAYAEAADVLLKVRELYQRLGDDAGWTAYIAGLRDRYRRLRALKEELAHAGL